jgi:hypothetical protein
MNLGALIVLFKLFQESGVSPPPDSNAKPKHDPCGHMTVGSPAWLQCKQEQAQKQDPCASLPFLSPAWRSCVEKQHELGLK